MKYFGTFIITSMLLGAPLIYGASEDNTNSRECEANNKNLDHWRMIKTRVKNVDANLHALDLLECLSSPDKELRDEIAYEVLTYWLRQDKLSDDLIYEMKEQLLPLLSIGSGESAGDHAFTRAFTALVLSELVRDDRRNNRWLGGDVDELITLSTSMFTAERDYRGLDPTHGWIHTIAHGSDLLWRLSRHPKTMVDQQIEILNALTGQINRLGVPPYTFNESDRIARVAASIIANPKVDRDVKVNWLDQLGAPTPWSKWVEAFSSTQGMARLHNVKQFLRALRESISSSENKELEEHINSLLSEMP